MGIVTLSATGASSLASSLGGPPLVLLSEALGTRPLGIAALAGAVPYGPITGQAGASVAASTLVDLLATTTATAGASAASATLVFLLASPGASALGVGSDATPVELFLAPTAVAGATSPPASFEGILNAPIATAQASAATAGLVFTLEGVEASAGATASVITFPDLLAAPTAAATAVGASPALVDLLIAAPVAASSSTASITLHVLINLGAGVAQAGAIASTVRLGPLPTPLIPTPVATVRLAGRILSPPTLITIAGLGPTGAPVPAASAGLSVLPAQTPITLYYAALPSSDITWLESLGAVYASLSYGDALHWSAPTLVAVTCVVGPTQLGFDGSVVTVTLTPQSSVPVRTSRWPAELY